MHQHLWPPAFVEALRARREPPHLEGAALVTIEGHFTFDVAAHDPEDRVRALDRDGIDVAVLSLQPTLGLERLPSPERTELEDIWAEGALGIVAASSGRFRALAPRSVRPGFVGTSAGASALLETADTAELLEEVDRSAGLLFVHPEAAGPRREGEPEWWSWTTGYTSQMQASYLAWLAGGRAHWPSARVVFAILAGGAPFQLERLAQRGVDVRSALDPKVFLDVSTYGRRAIELCIETFGVGQLVYGSDTPVVDSGPTLHAVRGFGDSVAQILQIDTPSALLA
jgi:6-methylsalicylate decarboxylase